MRKRPNKNIPAVTWVTLQPESSARTSLKSVEEYLSEIQEDMPRPPRRLCLSPETLKLLENAEKLVENAERQLSKMNFHSIITEELESEKFNHKANEEDKIYIRNVVASTLKKGYYDPASSAALAEHLRPSLSTRESHRPTSPSRTCRFHRFPQHPSIDPKKPGLDCLVCTSSKECRAAVEAPPKSIPEPSADEPPPPERLTVHRAPDVDIKAELAVRTVKIVDIQPRESVSSAGPRENVATFEIRHESLRPKPEPPVVEVQAAKPRVHSVHNKHKAHGEKLRHLTSPIEKRKKHRRRCEKATIDDIPIGELSLTEPRILADIDCLLDRQREVIRQLNRFDKFLALKLPCELSSSNELDPPVKNSAPVPVTIERNNILCANSKFRKPEELKEKSEKSQKSRRTVEVPAVETTESNEEESSTVLSEEVEIAKVDYTESFESASSVAGTRSDAGFVEDLQEANLDAGVCDERQGTEKRTPSPVASEVEVEVNLQVEVDEESVDEDKDGSETEKLQGSSQKTSHMIDSIPGTSPGKASELSNNSPRMSTASGNVESTESKIESRISEVRDNLDSLLRSIDSSERDNNTGAKVSEEVPKSTEVSAESRHNSNQNSIRSESFNRIERTNEVTNKNGGAGDLMNEFSKGLRVSEKSCSQFSESDGLAKKSQIKSIDSQTDLQKLFPPLDGGSSKLSIPEDSTNRNERDEVNMKSQASVLDDISCLLETSLEIDGVDVSDKMRQSKSSQDKISGDKSDKINNNAVGRSNEFVDGKSPIEDLIVGNTQGKQTPGVNEIPGAFKVLKKNDFVETKVDHRNDQGQDLCSKGVSKSLEASKRCDLIDRSDHRLDKVQNKQPIIFDERNLINREHNLSTTRSLITLLEENSVEVRDSFQQQKLTLLKMLESCSIPSSHRGKRVFTSTVLGDLEPPSSFARLKESSQSESSSDTYSEGEVRFSSSTSHSLGEIRRKNQFSKSSSLAKTTSSGSYNPTISLSHSAGEVSELAVD